MNAETDGRPVLWLGLYQDETDRRVDGRAGHYQSLEPVAGEGVLAQEVQHRVPQSTTSIVQSTTVAASTVTE